MYPKCTERSLYLQAILLLFGLHDEELSDDEAYSRDIYFVVESQVYCTIARYFRPGEYRYLG